MHFEMDIHDLGRRWPGRVCKPGRSVAWRGEVHAGSLWQQVSATTFDFADRRKHCPGRRFRATSQGLIEEQNTKLGRAVGAAGSKLCARGSGVRATVPLKSVSGCIRNEPSMLPRTFRSKNDAKAQAAVLSFGHCVWHGRCSPSVLQWSWCQYTRSTALKPARNRRVAWRSHGPTPGFESSTTRRAEARSLARKAARALSAGCCVS